MARWPRKATRPVTAVSGCTFTRNATPGATNGGAVYATYGNFTISASTFTENEAGYGGAISVYQYASVTLDAAVSITGNTAHVAGASGGGVSVFGDGVLNRNGATISGNTPDGCAGPGCF